MDIIAKVSVFLYNLKIMKPTVVIIGKPNVGKSTLFNRILKSKRAIVDKTAGVTIDRIYGDAIWEDKSFVVIDTGGLYPDSKEDIHLQVKQQAMFAIDEADIILLLFDGKEGLTEIDKEIVSLLRAINKPVIYILNKIDTKKAKQSFYEFFELGIDEIIPLSAITGEGFPELIDKITNILPQGKKEDKMLSIPKIAIVGKPNVGKSTYINALIGKERMVVSPLPGTTKDYVDSICRYYGKEYLIIDTAGLKKNKKIKYPLEKYMIVKAIKAVERADIVLLMISATEGITEQDQKIASLIQKYKKGIIVLFSKWDLVKEPENKYNFLKEEFQRKLYFINYAPILTVSGITRKRITKVFPLIDEIIKERKKRIPTSELNKFMIENITPYLPSYKGKKTKIYYATQPEIEPPQFVIFLNYPDALGEEHLRFIERKLREKYTFKGTQIKIQIRKRGSL